MTTICVNTIVKNEERYVWFAVESVIDYVDKVLIWDTRSTDHTAEIIKKLKDKYPDKINFREIGFVDREGFAALRQKMLEESDCDWVLILDGDEVWWKDSVKTIVATILTRGKSLESIVTPYINLVGDIYHRQEELAGKYKIDGRVGHLTIRAINRKIPGLHVDMPYGKEGYFDDKNIPIQERAGKEREFIDAPYLHFSHLLRSKKNREVIDREGKLKVEVGKAIPTDFYYPETLFIKRPEEVASPWRQASLAYWLKAYITEPARLLKRKLLHG